MEELRKVIEMFIEELDKDLARKINIAKKVKEIYEDLCERDVEMFQKVLNDFEIAYRNDNIEELKNAKEIIKRSVFAATIGLSYILDDELEIINILKEAGVELDEEKAKRNLLAIPEREELIDAINELVAEFNSEILNVDVREIFTFKPKEILEIINEFLNYINFAIDITGMAATGLYLTQDEIEPETFAEIYYKALSLAVAKETEEIVNNVEENEIENQEEIDFTDFLKDFISDLTSCVKENKTEKKEQGDIDLDNLMESIKDILEDLDKNVNFEENKEELNKTPKMEVAGQILCTNEVVEVIYDYELNKILIKSKLPVEVEVDPNFESEFPKSKDIGDINV